MAGSRAKRVVPVRLGSELVDALDAVAEAEGATRSDLIREGAEWRVGVSGDDSTSVAGGDVTKETP